MLLWCTKIQKIQLHIFQVPVKSVQTSSQVLQEPMPDKHHHGSHGSHSHGAHSHDSHGHPHQDSDVHEHHHNHPRDLFTADSQLSEQLTPYPQPRFYDPVSSRTLNSQKRRENSKRLQHQEHNHHHHSHGDSHRSQRLLHGGHDNSGRDILLQMDPIWPVDIGPKLGSGYWIQFGHWILCYITVWKFCDFLSLIFYLKSILWICGF